MSNSSDSDENIDVTSLLIEEFRNQPVDKQEEEIARLSSLHQGQHSIDKIPDETDFDFRVRSFLELLLSLPPGSLYSTKLGHTFYVISHYLPFPDITDAFKNQSVDKQESEIAKLSALHRGHSIEKLPDENDFDFRVRSFSLLFVNLPPGSKYSTKFGHTFYSTFKSKESSDITFAFRCLPVDRQEEEIERLSNSTLLRGGIPLIQKLPFESENDYRVRFFSELFVRLGPDSDYKVPLPPTDSGDNLSSTDVPHKVRGQIKAFSQVRRPVYIKQNNSKTQAEQEISNLTPGSRVGGFNPNYSKTS